MKMPGMTFREMTIPSTRSESARGIRQEVSECGTRDGPAQSNTDGLVMTGDLLRVLVVLVVLCLAGGYLMYHAVLAPSTISISRFFTRSR